MALKIGLQLYSVRTEFEKNLLETLKEVGKIGYKYLETVNLEANKKPGIGFSMPALELKDKLVGFGCEVFSAHIQPLDESNIDENIKYYKDLGVKCIISKSTFGTRAEVSANAKLWSALGQKIADAGLQHCIHVGMITFCEDGSNPLDILMEETKSEYLKFEPCTYWIQRSGLDPIDVICKYAPRVFYVHQKDLPGKVREVVNLNTFKKPGDKMTSEDFKKHKFHEDFCEIGMGVMDIQGIIDAAVRNTSAEYIVVEHDFTSLNEFDSIKLSFKNLKKYKQIIA